MNRMNHKINVFNILQLFVTFIWIEKSSGCYRSSYVPAVDQNIPYNTQHFNLPWIKSEWLDSADEDEPWVKHPVSPSQRKYDSYGCVCGLNSFDDGRIVGGEEADPREFLWAALLSVTVSKGIARCGASVINDITILTAAHCVIDMTIVKEHPEFDNSNYVVVPENIRIQISIHDTDKSSGITVKAVQVKFHHKFPKGLKRNTFDNDIALLILDKPLNFADPNIPKPVCIPTDPGLNTIGLKHIVVGWGLTDPNDHSSLSNNLRKVKIDSHSLEDCRRIVSNSIKISDHFICAGSLWATHDSSKGDSGGPLMIVSEDNRKQNTQVGIVSWGDYELKKQIYGSAPKERTVSLYTKVVDYLPYIDYYSDVYGAVWCNN